MEIDKPSRFPNAKDLLPIGEQGMVRRALESDQYKECAKRLEERETFDKLLDGVEIDF